MEGNNQALRLKTKNGGHLPVLRGGATFAGLGACCRCFVCEASLVTKILSTSLFAPVSAAKKQVCSTSLQIDLRYRP